MVETASLLFLEWDAEVRFSASGCWDPCEVAAQLGNCWSFRGHFFSSETFCQDEKKYKRKAVFVSHLYFATFA